MSRAGWFQRGLLLGTLALVANCGGNDGETGDAGTTAAIQSGVPRDKLMADLTSDESGKVCDAIATAQGGYGKKATCADGDDQTTDASHDACVTTYRTLKFFLQKCGLTVGQASLPT